MKLLTSLILMMVVPLAQANEPISMNVSKDQHSFVVTLAANPTTGYQWSVIQFDKQLLKLNSSAYQNPSTQLIGAGGSMLFTFKIKKTSYPDSTKLKFKYARPWEKEGTGTIQTVIVHFVEPK